MGSSAHRIDIGWLSKRLVWQMKRETRREKKRTSKLLTWFFLMRFFCEFPFSPFFKRNTLSAVDVDLNILPPKNEAKTTQNKKKMDKKRHHKNNNNEICAKAWALLVNGFIYLLPEISHLAAHLFGYCAFAFVNVRFLLLVRAHATVYCVSQRLCIRDTCKTPTQNSTD